jgi:spermidine synthase
MPNNNTPEFSPWDGKIHPDWYFYEDNKQWPGRGLILEAQEVLLETKSDFQDILVFRWNEKFWNVLALDGVVQITQWDEAWYQEILAHTPLAIVENPQHPLIIGGGDGWILRECLRHPSVEKVTQCEIDQGVIDAAKKYFPDISYGYSDPKTNLFIGDGAEYVTNTHDRYDSIIVDSSDPIGPAESLFTPEFYTNLKKKLSPKGSMAIQWESLFFHQELASELIANMRLLFKHAAYAQVHVPTYPWGNIGILVCSDSHDPSHPLKEYDAHLQSQLRYYNSEVHKASFILPNNLAHLNQK